jgi:hypothetical protein
MSKVEKVDNWLKLLFRLPSNVRYYTRMFDVLLPNGSKVVG